MRFTLARSARALCKTYGWGDCPQTTSEWDVADPTVIKIEHPVPKSGIVRFDQETKRQKKERDAAEVYTESGTKS